MIFNSIAKEINLYSAKKSLWRSTVDLKEIQQKKLRSLLEHAYATVPFYHKKFDDAGIKPRDIKNYSDLKKIPLLTKTELKTFGDSIFSRKVLLNECVLHRTSGSTGIPLKIYFTKKDNLVADISYERIRRENGFNPLRDVFLEITNSSFLPSDRKWYHRLCLSRRYKLNLLDPLSTQISVIQSVNPDVIWGYPSAIQNICNRLKVQGIDGIHPKFVFTASEILSDRTRQSIENFLDTTLLDIYGSHETGCIAWECCEHNGYHTSMDTNIIEFLDKNNHHIESDESGRVVITNLHSYAMPIIRYELGDYATPTGTSCSCGRGGYLIKSIHGRSGDFIKLPGNRMLSPLTINFVMKKYFDSISQFKLIQETEEIFTLYFIAVPGLDQIQFINDLENDLKTVLGENTVISILPVDQIQKEGSLKLRSVISKI